MNGPSRAAVLLRAPAMKSADTATRVKAATGGRQVVSTDRHRRPGMRTRAVLDQAGDTLRGHALGHRPAGRARLGHQPVFDHLRRATRVTALAPAEALARWWRNEIWRR